MKIAIGLETKDRTEVGQRNYLGETLANLVRGGVFDSEYLDSFHIALGGPTSQEFIQKHIYNHVNAEDVIVHHPGGPITRQRNGRRAILLPVKLTKADWILKLEDDIDVCADFLGSVARWLEKYGHANVPMFTLGATFTGQVSGNVMRDGENIMDRTQDWRSPTFRFVRQALARGEEILPHTVRGWFGAQAVVFKRHQANHLVDWMGDDPFLNDGRGEHRERGHDLLLQVWAASNGYKHFGAAIPSFVQHIGVQSNINNPFFEFPFAGREWSYKGSF